MTSQDRQTPFKCYRVANIDGKYQCLSATCEKIVGSWWHIRHSDGSITKANGGQLPTDKFNWWRTTIAEAWAGAINSEVLHVAYCAGPFCRESGNGLDHVSAARQRIWAMVADCFDEAHDFGRMLGYLEGKRGDPLPAFDSAAKNAKPLTAIESALRGEEQSK